jgi:hypothetical protein
MKIVERKVRITGTMKQKPYKDNKKSLRLSKKKKWEKTKQTEKLLLSRKRQGENL